MLLQRLVMFLEVELQLVILEVEQLVDALAQLHLDGFVFGIDPYLQERVLLALAQHHAHHLRGVEFLTDAGEQQSLPLAVEQRVLVLFIAEPDPAAALLPLLPQGFAALPEEHQLVVVRHFARTLQEAVVAEKLLDRVDRA